MNHGERRPDFAPIAKHVVRVGTAYNLEFVTLQDVGRAHLRAQFVFEFSRAVLR